MSLQICLAGTSEIKTNVVRHAFDYLGFKDFEIKNIEADINKLGYPEQPFGFRQAKACLFARMSQMFLNDKNDKPRNALFIAIENYIEYYAEPCRDYDVNLDNSQKIFVDLPVILISFGIESYWFTGEICDMPTLQVIKTAPNFQTKTVGSALLEDGIIKNSKDPHIELCGKSRTQILSDTICDFYDQRRNYERLEKIRYHANLD